MTKTETITVHADTLTLIDQSDLGQSAAGYLMLMAAACGYITEPDAESREEGLPDLWMSPADWDAWEQSLVEASHEDNLIASHEAWLEEEADRRQEFWD